MIEYASGQCPYASWAWRTIRRNPKVNLTHKAQETPIPIMQKKQGIQSNSDTEHCKVG